MEISVLKEAINKHRLKVTDHADEEMAADELILGEILYSVLHGEIIEDYPDDFPFPSCLIFGRNSGGEEIHSVWAYEELKEIAILVTVYRPDSEEWINWRRRVENE